MTKVARRHRKRKRQTKKQGEASRQKDIEKERRTERINMKMYGWAQTVTGRCIGGGRVIREACKVLRDKTSPH